jgi:AcrR family transcriptional regulator
MKEVAHRAYAMGARAETVAATGDRILDEAVRLFWAGPTDEMSLDDVARGAGVTRQTIIRRYGGRDGLMAAAAAREARRVRDHRDTAPADDVPAAVSVLVEHYERTGEQVIRMLAEEQRTPALTPIAESGRDLHRQWCARVFSAALTRRSGAARRRLEAQLVAVCDVYTWKLLRLDAGLSRRQTELALVELVAPLLEGP